MIKRNIFPLALLLVILAACNPVSNNFQTTNYTTTDRAMESSYIESDEYAVTQSGELRTADYEEDLARVETIFDEYQATVASTQNYVHGMVNVSYLHQRELQATDYALTVPKDQFTAFLEALEEIEGFEITYSESVIIDDTTIEEDIAFHEDEIARLEEEIENLTDTQTRLRNELYSEIRSHELAIQDLQDQQEGVETDQNDVTFNMTVREIDPVSDPSQATSTGGVVWANVVQMFRRIGWVFLDALFVIMWIIPYIIPVILVMVAFSLIIRAIRWAWFRIHPGAKERYEYRQARRRALSQKYRHWLEKDAFDGDEIVAETETVEKDISEEKE